jgi:hypothetical protein
LACGSDKPTQPAKPNEPAKPTEPTKPTALPGTLTVRLTTPNSDDAAMVLSITGPVTVANVATSLPGAVLHSRTVGGSSRVAIFGKLVTGELLHFTVPDVNAVAEFGVQLIEVSDRASALRANTSGYSAAVSR